VWPVDGRREREATTMNILIVDEVGDHGITSVDKDSVAQAIAPWFVDMPDEVAEGLAELQYRLTRHQGTEGLEAFLGIKIHHDRP
jgi:hypothetical protein